MDRSRRAMNPGNYNEDGTIKKGKKKWILSNLCAKCSARLQSSLLQQKDRNPKFENNV